MATTPDSVDQSPVLQLPDHVLPQVTSRSQKRRPAEESLPFRQAMWALRIVCCAGVCLSALLAWTSFRATDVYGCGASEIWDCSNVLQSRWSTVAGVPVSVPPFLLYASCLRRLAFCTPKAGTGQLFYRAWGFVSLCVFAAGSAAVWFISLQVFVIRQYCLYCLLGRGANDLS